MLFLKVFILITLLLIFIQDWKNRAVFWFFFPLLAVSLFFLNYLTHTGTEGIWQPSLINIGFLTIQLLLVTAYFSIKAKRPVNITRNLLGLGDILFLWSIAFYLSVLNFLFFYIASLVCVLLFWMFYQLIASKKDKQIPLAGIQALLFTVLLAIDWWFLNVHLNDDMWLLKLITK
ncbi:general secretion pathway protein [soil metagenome]